jgi:HSP20 family protein
MCTFEQIRNELSRSWEQVSDGWHNLMVQTNQALTAFKPILEYGIPQQHKQSPAFGLVPVELHEQDEVLSLRIEIPGLEQNTLDIQLQDNKLCIRGEKRMHHLQDQGVYHRLECAYGQFSRVVALPAAVQFEEANAVYQNGVLTMVLPKKQTQKQRIEVLFE